MKKTKNNEAKEGSLLFDPQYSVILGRTRKTFTPFYVLHTETLKQVLVMKDALIKEIEAGCDPDFNKVALLLLSRSIQHAESVFLLTERGLYGDTMVVIRGVLSDMKMLIYLDHNPDFIPSFLKESGTSYQDDKLFKKRFSEAAIEKDLQAHGSALGGRSFAILSKTSHASAWGAQLFGTEGKDNGNKEYFHLKYGPGFETKKALAIFSMVIGTHIDFLNIVGRHRVGSKINLESALWKRLYHFAEDMTPRVSSLAKRAEDALRKIK